MLNVEQSYINLLGFCVSKCIHASLCRAHLSTLFQNYKNTIHADQLLLSSVPRPIETDSGMPAKMIHSTMFGTGFVVAT